MAVGEWYEIVEMLKPYVVRIWTPQGSGTGFVISNGQSTALCAVATAFHVVGHANWWEEPIRIEHSASGKTLLLRESDRVINLHPQTDTAAILFERGDLGIPTKPLTLIDKGNVLKPGVEIGWLGFPAIQGASLCFFSGRISAWVGELSAYFVDGVAINGVSGGPACTVHGLLAGVVTDYFPNRATGEPLPGLALIRGVEQFHEFAEQFRSLDEARAHTPARAEPPPPDAGGT